MGRPVNHDARYSDEDRAYLESRGRGYMIQVNERRFGTEEAPTDTPEGPQVNQFYDDSVRQKAVYDCGGAPLPDTTLDYNTGRVKDRDNGVLVEYTGPGHQPGAHDLRIGGIRRHSDEFFEGGYAVDEQGNPVEEIDIDEDIVEKVMNQPNKPALKRELAKLNVEVDASATREELENALAVALQDARDAEKVKA